MVTNIAHIAETAVLLLAAYSLGCTIGYALHRIIHAARGTRIVSKPQDAIAAAAEPIVPERPRSPAIRLAASVDDLPTTSTARPVLPPADLVAAPSIEPVTAMPSTKKPPLLAAQAKSLRATRRIKSTDPKPAALSYPRPDGADNLKQIKGIGPKIEASLYGMGIFHIDQIAGWSKANIDWVDGQLAFKGRIQRERWVEQAAELSRARKSA